MVAELQSALQELNPLPTETTKLSNQRVPDLDVCGKKKQVSKTSEEDNKRGIHYSLQKDLQIEQQHVLKEKISWVEANTLTEKIRQRDKQSTP